MSKHITETLWRTAADIVTAEAEALPFIFIVKDNHIIAHGQVNFSSEALKMQSCRQASALARRTGADLVVVISESWIKKLAPGETIPEGRVKNMEGRQEALSLVEVTPDGSGVMYFAEIKTEGKGRSLGPRIVESAQTHLVPPWGTIIVH
ncbi:MAG: hypothetical protein P1V51_19860 [Deltaproteobacteria bacterium]|nr:hypothetical protein [Deltaproteobacteria bacterium]